MKEEEEEEKEGEAGPSHAGGGEETDTLIDEDELLRQAYENYEVGKYSPKLIRATDVEEVQTSHVIEYVHYCYVLSPSLTLRT